MLREIVLPAICDQQNKVKCASQIYIFCFWRLIFIYFLLFPLVNREFIQWNIAVSFFLNVLMLKEFAISILGLICCFACMISP